MIYVFHGDDQTSSREAFTRKSISLTTKSDAEIIHLDGKKIGATDLIQASQPNQLFGSSKVLLLEHCFSQPKSKRKGEILEALNDISETNETADILIWEKKLLTATQLKPVKKIEVTTFKISKQIFTFLDSIKPGASTQIYAHLQKTLQQDAHELVFFMLVKRVRLLIQIKDSGKLSGVPWQQQRLKTQANAFELKNLLRIHTQLLEIDISIKTGQSLLKLGELLDILVLKI